MASTMYRKVAVVSLILSVLSTSSNTNQKYVKGEEIGRNHVRSIGKTEDLCKLGSFFGGAGELQIAGAEDLKRVSSVEMLSAATAAESFADKEGTKKARAVVHGLERSLLGSGAHREVYSMISLEVQIGVDAPQEMVVSDDCELVILEHLSAGVFADPFQLNRLQQQEAVKDAHIYGDVDLERPATNSYQSIVELRQRLVPDKNDGLEVLYQSEVTLPLHARYPPTSSESHVLVNITVPHVLVYCRGDNVTGTKERLNQELCIYALWGDKVSDSPRHLLQWSIPSGYPAHAARVGRITMSAALAGVAAIFMASKVSGLKHNLKSQHRETAPSEMF